MRAYIGFKFLTEWIRQDFGMTAVVFYLLFYFKSLWAVFLGFGKRLVQPVKLVAIDQFNVKRDQVADNNPWKSKQHDAEEKQMFGWFPTRLVHSTVIWTCKVDKKIKSSNKKLKNFEIIKKDT